MYNIKFDHLEKFMITVLKVTGMEERQAKICAKNISFADKQGTDTHGILRIPNYISRIKAGLINVQPNIQWKNETDSTVVLNADNSMGHYAAEIAMEKAIEKAEQQGIGFATVYNTNHVGAAACYARMAAEKEMIGFFTTNAGPTMAPFGGKDKILGNNPLSFAVPRKGNEPIVLDIAFSTVALGKLMVASAKGEKIPLGWALDAEGVPTTDPDEGIKGLLEAVGGHKGSGLALIMDILAGVLSGAKYSHQVRLMTDMENTTGVGATMIVININKIMPTEIFGDRLEDFVETILSSQKAPGFDRILLPGEIEKETRERRASEGVNIPESLHTTLLEMCEDLNINPNEFGL